MGARQGTTLAGLAGGKLAGPEGPPTFRGSFVTPRVPKEPRNAGTRHAARSPVPSLRPASQRNHATPEPAGLAFRGSFVTHCVPKEPRNAGTGTRHVPRFLRCAPPPEGTAQRNNPLAGAPPAPHGPPSAPNHRQPGTGWTFPLTLLGGNVQSVPSLGASGNQRRRELRRCRPEARRPGQVRLKRDLGPAEGRVSLP